MKLIFMYFVKQLKMIQSEDTPAAVNGLLMIVPPFALYRGLLDLSLFTTFGGLCTETILLHHY